MQLSILLPLAFIYFLCSCHADDSASSTLSTDEANGYLIVDLKYKGLIAHVNSGPALPEYGNDPNSMWAELAKRVTADANAAPFSTQGSAPRYDLWPLLTLKPGTQDPVDPSYLVRLSLIPGPGCATRAIDQEFLRAFANLFTDLASRARKPNYSFTGTVDQGRTNFYEFKLESTGKNVAQSVWTQDHIDQTILDTLEGARAHILQNTKPRDTILCVGGSGSLLSYILNRDGDEEKDRRIVWLIPVSEVGAWSQRIHLDVLHSHPDLYNRYKATVLKPAIEARRVFGKVIFLNYLRTGETQRELQTILRESNIWTGTIYNMDIKSKDDPRKKPNMWSFSKKPSIYLPNNQQRALITDGGLPRVIPFYPWQWWDVDWESAYNPDHALAPGIITALKTNTSQIPPVSGKTTPTGGEVPTFRTRRFHSEDIRARADATTSTAEDNTDVDGEETSYGMQDTLPWPINPAQGCAAGVQASAVSVPATVAVSQPEATGSVAPASEAATSRRFRKQKGRRDGSELRGM